MLNGPEKKKLLVVKNECIGNEWEMKYIYWKCLVRPNKMLLKA